MDITVTISDGQWQEFQQLAKETVESTWNGNYEDFATYIMIVNINTYIDSQKKKQEKKKKRALADYEEMLKKEQDISMIQSLDSKPESTLMVLVEKPLEKKKKPTSLTNKELLERIKELRDIMPDKRTSAEIDELNTLLDRRKDKYKKKQQRREGNHI